MRHRHTSVYHVLFVTTLFLLTTFTATSALAQDPYLMSNNSWISISGTVKSVSADLFTLDYGDGLITVEMDDGDRDADAYKLIPGDEVTGERHDRRRPL